MKTLVSGLKHYKKKLQLEFCNFFFRRKLTCCLIWASASFTIFCWLSLSAISCSPKCCTSAERFAAPASLRVTRSRNSCSTELCDVSLAAMLRDCSWICCSVWCKDCLQCAQRWCIKLLFVVCCLLWCCLLLFLLLLVVVCCSYFCFFLAITANKLSNSPCNLLYLHILLVFAVWQQQCCWQERQDSSSDQNIEVDEQTDQLPSVLSHLTSDIWWKSCLASSLVPFTWSWRAVLSEWLTCSAPRISERCSSIIRWTRDASSATR